MAKVNRSEALAPHATTPHYGPVSTERVVLVGDAHLGSASLRDEEALHEFLEAVPSIGGRLVLMGDLFDFWFEYRAVIPRRPFKTLTRLAVLRERGVAIDMFGGNHDRWGGSFWAEDLGIAFHGDGADLVLAGRKTHLAHGDGLAEQKLGGKLIHRITRSRITIGTFRALHPDLGFRLADRLSGGLAEANKSDEALAAAAAAQERYATAYLQAHPDVNLIVLAHTHRQRCVEVSPGRFYLNAGQWMGELCYATLTAERIDMLRWPARPA
jgi:UDP-2,3-diacylglucosamine hydrolase